MGERKEERRLLDAKKERQKIKCWRKRERNRER